MSDFMFHLCESQKILDTMPRGAECNNRGKYVYHQLDKRTKQLIKTWRSLSEIIDYFKKKGVDVHYKQITKAFCGGQVFAAGFRWSRSLTEEQ